MRAQASTVEGRSPEGASDAAPEPAEAALGKAIAAAGLVGDAADGYPGLPGWGAKSTAGVLSRFPRLEDIPDDWRTWNANVTSPASLSRTLLREREQAFLFRRLATLRTDIPLFDNVDALQWKGPTPDFASMAARLDAALRPITLP